KQHLIVRRHVAERADVCVGLLENRFECLRPMTDLENRHADPRQRDEIALDFLEHRHGQHGRPGGEVVNAMDSGHMVTRCKSRMSLFPPCMAFSSASEGAPSRWMRATAACAPSKITS